MRVDDGVPFPGEVFRQWIRDVFINCKALGVVVLVLVVVASAGCGFPRDPRGTLDSVQNGTMRVGIVANDPWARMEDGRASGVEVDLLGDFAEELGPKPLSCRARRPSC